MYICIHHLTFITGVTQDLPETVVALINEKVFLTCDVSTVSPGDSTDLILDKAYRAGVNSISNVKKRISHGHILVLILLMIKLDTI